MLKARNLLCLVVLTLRISLTYGNEPPTLTPAQIYENVKPSIVFVEVLRKKTGKWSSGSGVVFEGGQIITNCHVIRDAKKVEVSQGDSVCPPQLGVA